MRLPKGAPAYAAVGGDGVRLCVARLREIYGQHRCDASKVITVAQKNLDVGAINDCLGQPDGSLVDNVEDVDTDPAFQAP